MTEHPTPRQAAFVVGSMLLAPLIILYATQLVWTQSLSAPLLWMGTHLPAVGLFWVLFASVSFMLFGFTRRLFWANWPGVCLCMAVAVISRYKMDINGEPLQLSDFAFAGALGDIAGFASQNLIPSVLTVLGVLIAAVLTETLRRKQAWKPRVAPCFVLGSLCMVLFFSALYPGTLQNAAIALEEGCQDQEERNEQVGVALGIYSAWSQRLMVERGASDPEAVRLAHQFRDDLTDPVPQLGPEQPDIIFITSESFFDITRLPGLTFDQDPIPVFHALAETCTDGMFLSNTYGGGTGNVEMEMFTGMSSSFLKEGDSMTTLSENTYNTIPATVRTLRAAGYTTTFLHTHTNALYNRSTTHPAIGFQKVLFREDVPNGYDKGAYCADEAFAQEIIRLYEERDVSKPCYLYGLSMENHQPYLTTKYDEPSGYTVQCDALSREDKDLLDSLVMGLHDADASLKTLVDYFSQVDRPVLLVFVGDHLPSSNMADGTSLYARLGYSLTEEATNWSAEMMANILSTNYLVWSNYETAPAADHTESCTFLGLHTLQRAGVPRTGYFAWLEENVADRMLLYRRKLFVSADGVPTYEISPETQQMLDRYAAVERNLLYNH